MTFNTTSELIKHQAEIYKNKIFAIFSEDKSKITYYELYMSSLVYSNFFKNNNILKGSRVSVVLPTCKDFILTLTGLLNLGSIVNPVDINMLEEDASKNIDRFKSEFIVFSPIMDEYISNLKNFINTKDTIFICIESNQIKNKTKNKLESKVAKSDPALGIFTSGTTGDPKGVICSHENILVGASNLKVSHNINENDRLLSVTPLTGINGNIFSIWSPLYTGSSVVYFQEMFTSYRIFELLEKYKITWFNCVPTHFSLMINLPVKKEEFNLNSVRFMRSASAPLSPIIQKKFEEMYQIPIIETMGITEMTGQITSNPMDPNLRKIGSVGKPINTKIKIVDDNGKQLKPNITGEILVTGKGLMICYFDDEEATKNSVKNGWLYTGDIGYLDNDGYLFVKGRKKDIIIVGGKNVSMREIEEVIISHKKVQDVVAFGIPDDITGEKIVAYIKPKNKVKISAKEIMDFCNQHLSSYKCPKLVKLCKSFPRGGQGKILRSKVKEQFLEENRDG